jgi:polysaccharide biosynthesis transport protein
MSTNRLPEPLRDQLIHERSAQTMEPFVLPPIHGRMHSPERFVPLAAYWHVVWKHRWMIFLFTFVLTAVVAIVSFRMTPIYKATARIEIEPETPQLQSSSDPYSRADADDVFLQTQVQILKSDNLAWQTIQQLGLARNLGVVPADKVTPKEIEKYKARLIAAFQQSLKVELLAKTRILSVGFESPDPQLAAQVATTLVNNYLDYNFKQKYEAINRSGWMDQQLADLKDKVEKSQQAVVAYEQQHLIANTGDKQSVQEQMLADLSRDLTSATSDRMQKESMYRETLSNRAHMATLVHDDLLQRLEERLADLKEQRSEALAQYGPNFPKVTRLESQISELQSQVDKEQSRIIDRTSNDYKTAASREKLAAAAVANQKEDLGRMNGLLVQHNILQREFESNQQLYQNLLQRVKDASISAGLRSTNIHLVDSALAPTLPIRPTKKLNIAVALWVGIFLGILAAFARDKMDSSIRTAEEAEALAVTPALGVIPFERKSWLKMRTLPKNGRHWHLTRTLTEQPTSSLSEAFRALGTAVAVPSRPVKTLLITSAQNGEGKTVTTLNLGQALAQRMTPVLIIDGDMRRGTVAKALGIKNNKGLSTVLSGDDDFSEAIHKHGPNLWVLPSGPVPSNPAELLASQAMTNLLENMAIHFKHIIVDSPPVLAVTDATILSSLADGVLLVAASGSTPRASLVRTRRILANSGARLLGVTVNKLNLRSQGYQNYGYGYSSQQ